MSEEPAQASPGPATPAAEIERDGRRALWFGVGSIVLSIFAPVGSLFGTAAAVAAMVIGVRANGRSQGRRNVPGAVGGIVLGTVGLVLSVLSFVVVMYTWPELTGYRDCMAGANTITDQQACHDTWGPKFDRKLKITSGGVPWFDSSL